MKKLFKSTIAVLAIGSLFLASCNKYEEGANFSLRSKKGRFAGVWHVEKVELNGTDVTSSYLPSGATMTQTIEKDGTWTSTYTISSLSNTEKGTWELVDSKEKVKMVTEGSTDTDGDTSTIVMLKNKELKLKSTSGSNVTIITMHQD